MFSLNSINSNIISPLANKNNSNNTEKTNTNKFSSHLQDAYVSSEETDSASGTYSKLAEQVINIKYVVYDKGFTEEEYQKYCTLFYNCTKDGSWEPVYFPPPNAPDEVKRAWIDTMRLFSEEEQALVKNTIADVVTKVFKKYKFVSTEMYQNYLNNHASDRQFINLFLKGLKNSANKECHQLMEDVLDKFRKKYKEYTELVRV